MPRPLLIATFIQTLAILVAGCSRSLTVSKLRQHGLFTVVSVTCHQALAITSVKMNEEPELIPWEATNTGIQQRAVVFATRNINTQHSVAYADGVFVTHTDFRPLRSVPCKMGETKEFAHDARFGTTLVRFTIETSTGSHSYQWRE